MRWVKNIEELQHCYSGAAMPQLSAFCCTALVLPWCGSLIFFFFVMMVRVDHRSRGTVPELDLYPELDYFWEKTVNTLCLLGFKCALVFIFVCTSSSCVCTFLFSTLNRRCGPGSGIGGLCDGREAMCHVHRQPLALRGKCDSAHHQKYVPPLTVT